MKKTFRRYKMANPPRGKDLLGDAAMSRAFNPRAGVSATNMGWVNPMPNMWTEEKPSIVSIDLDEVVIMSMRVDQETSPNSKLVQIELRRQIDLWRETLDEGQDKNKISREMLATLRDRAREIVREKMPPRIGIHQVNIFPGAREVWLENPTRVAQDVFLDLFMSTFQSTLTPLAPPCEWTDTEMLTDLWKVARVSGRLEPPDADDQEILDESIIVTLGPTSQILFPDGGSVLKIDEPPDTLLDTCAEAIREGGKVLSLDVALAHGMTPLGFAKLSVKKGLDVLSVSIEGWKPSDTSILWSEKEKEKIQAVRECVEALDKVMEGVRDKTIVDSWYEKDLEKDEKFKEELLERARTMPMDDIVPPPLTKTIM